MWDKGREAVNFRFAKFHGRMCKETQLRTSDFSLSTLTEGPRDGDMHIKAFVQRTTDSKCVINFVCNGSSINVWPGDSDS
jgi:hypothetical protein